MSQPYQIVQLADWAEVTRLQKEEPWLLEGLIPQTGITLISGRQKEAKKSWLVRLMTIAMATGRQFQNIKPSGPVPVWLIDREGSAPLTLDAWDKLARGMGFSLEETRPNLHYTHLGAFFLTEKSHIDSAVRYIATHGIKCVIIDTFAKSFIGDENSAEVTGAALRACAKIQNAGAAVVLVHHLKKGELSVKGDEPAPDEDIRGSGAIAGGFDSHLALRKYPELGNVLYLLYGGKYASWRASELDWRISNDGVVDPTTGEVLGHATLKMVDVEFPVIEKDWSER